VGPRAVLDVCLQSCGLVNMYRRVEGSWCASSLGVKQTPLVGLHDPADEGTTILLSSCCVTN
jgi:hypothetical protein